MKNTIYILLFTVLVPNHALGQTAVVFPLSTTEQPQKTYTAKYETWFEKKLETITKKFDSAQQFISNSTFSQEHKTLLRQQAAENRQLSTKQAEEWNKLRARHQKERESMVQEIKSSPLNRQAVQKVINIK